HQPRGFMNYAVERSQFLEFGRHALGAGLPRRYWTSRSVPESASATPAPRTKNGSRLRGATAKTARHNPTNGNANTSIHETFSFLRIANQRLSPAKRPPPRQIQGLSTSRVTRIAATTSPIKSQARR